MCVPLLGVLRGLLASGMLSSIFEAWLGGWQQIDRWNSDPPINLNTGSYADFGCRIFRPWGHGRYIHMGVSRIIYSISTMLWTSGSKHFSTCQLMVSKMFLSSSEKMVRDLFVLFFLFRGNLEPLAGSYDVGPQVVVWPNGAASYCVFWVVILFSLAKFS